MFATDRDLLILEPNLFRDLAWAGQRLIEAAGSVSGTTLTLSGADAAAVGVTTGHVAMVNGLPVEVVQRLSSTQLQVSRLRADSAAALIPPPAVSGQPVVIATFAPQLALVHAQLLRLLGIDPADPPNLPGAAHPLSESSITNPRALCLLESLGALHLILSAASALSGPTSALGLRAAGYRDRFIAERGRTAAQLDLDGDGLADTTRHLNTIPLVRS